MNVYLPLYCVTCSFPCNTGNDGMLIGKVYIFFNFPSCVEVHFRFIEKDAVGKHMALVLRARVRGTVKTLQEILNWTLFSVVFVNLDKPLLNLRSSARLWG